MISKTYALQADENFTKFEFVSDGAKGRIKKVISFHPTFINGFYNLTLSNETTVNEPFEFSDDADAGRIVATLLSAIYAFTDYRKNALVYAIPNTASRARLYRMIITRYSREIRSNFILFGFSGNSWENFRKDADYLAFAFRKR